MTNGLKRSVKCVYWDGVWSPLLFLYRPISSETSWEAAHKKIIFPFLLGFLLQRREKHLDPLFVSYAQSKADLTFKFTPVYGSGCVVVSSHRLSVGSGDDPVRVRSSLISPHTFFLGESSWSSLSEWSHLCHEWMVRLLGELPSEVLAKSRF